MAIKSFEECLGIVQGGVPNSLKANKEFNQLLKVLAYSMQKNYDELNRIDNAYNVDFVDIRELSKLADTIGIVYPLGATDEVLRLILKYYGKILKNRGTLDSIKQMVRLLEYGESDLYAGSLDDYTNVSASIEEEGFIFIKYDGIMDFEYAYRMLRKVVPAGYRFEVANKTGPYNKGFDRGIGSDSALSIEILVGDSIVAGESFSIYVETLPDNIVVVSDSLVGEDSGYTTQFIG